MVKIIDTILNIIFFFIKRKKKRSQEILEDPALARFKDFIVNKVSNKKLVGHPIKNQLMVNYWQIGFASALNCCVKIAKEYKKIEAQDHGSVLKMMTDEVFSYYPKKADAIGIPECLIKAMDEWNLPNIDVIVNDLYDTLVNSIYPPEEKWKHINKSAYIACHYMWLMAVRDFKYLNGDLDMKLDDWIDSNDRPGGAVDRLMAYDVCEMFQED